MGKYIRKCKGIGEIAVMEVGHVGVRTRTRALAMALTASASSRTEKRRKVGDGKLKFSSSLVQHRSRRRVVVTPENSVTPATSGNSVQRMVLNDRCSTTSSDHVSVSSCSSNASTDLANERLKIIDLEDDSLQIETSTCDIDSRESFCRKETTPSSELQVESGDLESTARPSEATSRRISSAEKIPYDTELEEFFAAAEKDLQKRFTEKFNYDIAKDVPLEGRYEWVRLKP